MTTETNAINANATTPLLVSQGGTGSNSFTSYGVICGGTTSTGNIQSVAGLGNSGYVLTSNGAGTLPTFQTIGSGAGIFSSIEFSSNTGILDSNVNNMLKLSPVSSSVNYWTIGNNISGSSPSLTATSGTDTNVLATFKGQGNSGCAIQGTTSATNAPAGYVGEVISSVISSGSPISISSLALKDMTSISLTAGDWDVWGNIFFTCSGTYITEFFCWISTSSASFPDASLLNGGLWTTTSTEFGINTPYNRINISTTTTVYISGIVNFATGTCNMCGGIYARRAR